ncbi:MAG: anti-sigma factor antagonist [Clostridiaceae bacterium]|nr:anti-sigma factor antagonist [Clostridiaceae bacterium]
MNVNYEQKNKLLLLEITEEIDHHTSEKIRRRADNEITRYMPRKVIFDFSNVTFMDSAGIGVVLGRYKMIKMLGGTLELKNVSLNLKKIFEMSGITKICPTTIKQAI